MAALTELTEDAIIAWIADHADHGITFPFTARRFGSTKFKSDGTIDDIKLPACIVEAQQTRQLNAQVAVYLMDCEVMLWMQADDTNKATWDLVAGQLDTILEAANLASFLTALGTASTGFTVGGVVTRDLGRKETNEHHWKRSYRLQLWAGQAYTT
jgi:hypothetical protein